MKQLVLVLSEPQPGQDDAFNEWYEHTHLDEVLATTGWTGARRYVLRDQAGQGCPLPYLALYEVDTDDPQSIIPTMNATRAQRQQNAALNRRTAGVWVFEATGPEHRPPA